MSSHVNFFLHMVMINSNPMVWRPINPVCHPLPATSTRRSSLWSRQRWRRRPPARGAGAKALLLHSRGQPRNRALALRGLPHPESIFFLELLVLLPEPLHFPLQPLTLFHHLLNFSVIQRRTQSFRYRWCFCLWCSCGYNFIYFYIMLFRNKWKPKCHQLCNKGLFYAK